MLVWGTAWEAPRVLSAFIREILLRLRLRLLSSLPLLLSLLLLLFLLFWLFLL